MYGSKQGCSTTSLQSQDIWPRGHPYVLENLAVGTNGNSTQPNSASFGPMQGRRIRTKSHPLHIQIRLSYSPPLHIWIGNAVPHPAPNILLNHGQAALPPPMSPTLPHAFGQDWATPSLPPHLPGMGLLCLTPPNPTPPHTCIWTVAGLLLPPHIQIRAILCTPSSPWHVWTRLGLPTHPPWPQ